MGCLVFPRWVIQLNKWLFIYDVVNQKCTYKPWGTIVHPVFFTFWILIACTNILQKQIWGAEGCTVLP